MLREILRNRGIEQLYTHQAAAIAHALAGRNVVITTPTASGKTLCYNAPVSERDSSRRFNARAVSLPDQGARPGSAGGAARAVGPAVTSEVSTSIGVFTYDGDTPQDARRVDSRSRARGAQQPRHDPLGHPAAPSALGEALRESQVRRHRRAARVSRRVRQPPDERAAAAASHLPPLRVEPRIHLLVGNDCQPARARGSARRAAVRARLRERRAERREVLSVRQSSGRQSAARHPAVVSGRNAPCRRRVPEAEAAAHRLHAKPADDRNPHDVPEGRFRGPAGDTRADPRLSRRVPAAAAA